MDTEELKARISEFLKKYRFVLLVLLAGLLLMMIPERKASQTPVAQEQDQQEETMQDSLAHILSRIQGAGKVEVLLTQYRGSETLYQTDIQQSADSLRENTVLTSDAQREDHGLIRQINPPVYLGAVVVCQGGDSPKVRLAIVEAIMSVTGLSSDKITVLKMK